VCATREFVIVGDMIRSVDSANGQQPKCSFNVSLGSTDQTVYGERGIVLYLFNL
jgi:hypothetical protein